MGGGKEAAEEVPKEWMELDAEENPLLGVVTSGGMRSRSGSKEGRDEGRAPKKLGAFAMLGAILGGGKVTNTSKFWSESSSSHSCSLLERVGYKNTLLPWSPRLLTYLSVLPSGDSEKTVLMPLLYLSMLGISFEHCHQQYHLEEGGDSKGGFVIKNGLICCCCF